ncbi:MAG: glutamate--tRNA ligase [Halobacteriota archaeon]
MDPEQLKNLIRKRALDNARRHDGKAELTAVISGTIGENPDLKQRARGIASMARTVVEEINALSTDEQDQLIKEIAPELQERTSARRHKDEYLPALPQSDHVVMRFAPNPNGPATLGSARGIVVNSQYAKRYDGSFILRFDDTDPQTKRPMLEAYDWYLDDCVWLGAPPDAVITASDRIGTYYRYAEQLIEQGAAYVCTCPQQQFKELKDARLACPDRERTPEQNLALWKEMLDGNFGEKEAVLRIKTDIEHKNPALRDWVAFRIIDVIHPRGLTFRVWPMLDFESAIEDYMLGVTHIIRGKDLRDSEQRQRFLYDHFKWSYPFTLHWGRIRIHEYGKFSTSALKKQIEQGVYRGWDDPQLPTIRALRRRGFMAQAIRQFMLKLGINESDISISLENLYAENRKLVDPIAKRYFFVPNPKMMHVRGVAPTIARAPVHPSKPDLVRKIAVGSQVYISETDLKFSCGDVIRLKDLYNVRITSKEPLEAEYAGNEITRGLHIIQWAPPEGPLVEVLRPNGVDTGIGEQGIEKEQDRVVQFERYGFVRVDDAKPHGERLKIVCYFTHK